MQFASLSFAGFFAIVFLVYWMTPWSRVRVWWLLLASIWFYASWSRELALLVTATSVMDYLLARGMDRFRDGRWRKSLLAVSLGVNLGLLCYFKYVNFFLDSLRAALAAAGVTGRIPTLEILVPFGISFYTFEAISYTIDVYRKRIKAETNLANFMLFILFFPHLVAGPIVRAWDFLSQVKRPKRFSWLRLNFGAQLFILGLFKKLVISDRVALFSDPVFEHPELYSGQALWLGLLAFAVRIWADFSGYSDMALGAAHCLGYKLTKNFNLPYLSLNIAEFWRRWHISLSTWLRDYLFIPLGGSRGSRFETCRNLMITMTLGGLWHGANWSYVLWGVVHGLFLVVHSLFRGVLGTSPNLRWALDTWPGKLARWALTMMCVLLAWSLFQPSLAISKTMLKRMIKLPIGESLPLEVESLCVLLIVVALAHLLASRPFWRSALGRLPAPIMGFATAVCLMLALFLAPQEFKVFIYFQF